MTEVLMDPDTAWLQPLAAVDAGTGRLQRVIPFGVTPEGDGRVACADTTSKSIVSTRILGIGARCPLCHSLSPTRVRHGFVGKRRTDVRELCVRDREVAVVAWAPEFGGRK